MAEADERIRNMQKQGILVPDQETINYMENYITKNNISFQNLIFDGFPRSMSQYDLLKEWLKQKGAEIDYVIYLDVGEKTSIERLSSRRICEECGEVYNLITKPPREMDKCDICGGKLIQRNDDKPETIKKRLEIFRKETMPIVNHVKKEEKLIIVDSERPVKVIFKEILSKLGKKAK